MGRSRESSLIKLSIQNTTIFRTDAATPATLERRSYIPVDRAMIRNGKVSPRSRLLFVYLMALEPDENPSQKELGRQLGFGNSKIRAMLRELEDAGWISQTPISFNNAKTNRVDLLGSEHWPPLALVPNETESDPVESEVPNETESAPADIETSSTESDPNRADPTNSQTQTEPTEKQVGPIGVQQETSNPCPATVTTPLIKGIKKSKNNKSKGKERKGENPPPPLVVVGSVCDMPGQPSSWVSAAKQLQNFFTLDADFIFDVLNPWVKAKFSEGADLAGFIDYVGEALEARDGRIYGARKQVILVLYSDFVYRSGTETRRYG